MKNNRMLWRWLAFIFVLSFGALGYLGWQIYLTAPPIPKAVVTADGDTVFTGEQIQEGQRAWLSAGGQQLGTVWGHGSYVAPDWSADWLHRETVAQLDSKAGGPGAFELLADGPKAALEAEMRGGLRANGFDRASGTLTISDARAAAIKAENAERANSVQLDSA